jgi:uncharacterized iron-regulated membrane protein
VTDGEIGMEKVANGLWRTLIVTHRYLGIAVGLLMLIWFLSGIVMMYVGFPQPLGAERLLSLPNINWRACCHVADGVLPDGQRMARAEIEMLLGVPVLRLPRPPVPDQRINLADGGGVSTLELGEAQEVALATMTRPSGEAPPIAAAEEIEQDQWILNRFERERPVYRFAFADAEGTVLYVSGQSGNILLRTTASQRFWNWFGAIPHWLYFKDLRTDRWLWMQTVVWTSIIGSFLSLFGLYLGIAQWLRGKNGRLSPYRGMFYWHHITGLVFGVVALAFVASGLVSMNPWGFLDSRGAAGERGRLEGSAPPWAAVRASVEALRAHAIDAVHVSLSRSSGDLYWLAAKADGSVTRLDAAGNPAPVGEAELTSAAARLAGTNGIAEQRLISESDTYFVDSGGRLPVYRVILNDTENTRYYLDPVTGALLARVDANRRWHRWLFGAIHRLDFAAWVRVRPMWDIILIALMLGGFAVSATGVYLAVRRVQNDVIMLFRAVTSSRGIARRNLE